MPKKIEEPFFDHPPTGIEMIEAYNRYHDDFTHADALKFLLEYLKKTDQKEMIEVVHKFDKNYLSTTACWIARMLFNGIDVPDHSRNFLQTKLDEMRARVEKKETEVVERPKVSVQQNIKNKAYALIDTIEKMIEKNKFVDIKIYEFLYSKNISESVAMHIWDYFKCVLDELQSIKDDKAAQEAYAHLSVEDIRDRVVFYTNFLTAVHQYEVFKSGILDKVIPAKKLKDFKYLSVWNNFVSIDPEKIEGAKAVWTYNTKYNYLNCIRGDNLSVKGSRIINEDASKSWAKIVKADFADVNSLIASGADPETIKARIKNQTEYKVTLLSNEFTVILKVVK